MGCIFACGHVVVYARAFLPRLPRGFDVTSINLFMSLTLSLILTVLLVLLTVTSFVVIRKAMNPEMWKRVQSLAYPFFGLVYLHLVLVLAPSALVGKTSAVVSLVVYTALFGSYLVLRTRKAVLDKRQIRAKDATA
jgi:DMSO/TMAO reductase YedYZ heme-binding membrane subunit